MFNLRRLCNMRDINPEDIDQLIAVRGTLASSRYPTTAVITCVSPAVCMPKRHT